MACKFCGGKDESRLGMRSSVVNGKVKNDEICFSCLGKKLMQDDGKLLSTNKQLEREYLYSELGKNAN